MVGTNISADIGTFVGTNISNEPGAADAPSLESIAANLLYRWKSDSAGVTRDGSNLVAAVANIDAFGVAIGSADLTQGTAANKPIYRSSGFGPNSVSWVELQDTSDLLTATITVAAGNRAGIYIVGKVGNTNGFYSWRVTHSAGESRMVNNATQYLVRVEFTGGQQAITVTSPAKDTLGGGHLFAIRPLASGALLQIDGTTTNPDVTGTDTLKALSDLRIGFGSGLSDTGSGIREVIIVDDSSDPIDTVIKDYVAYDTGITLA